jgi:hypothetical protein
MSTPEENARRRGWPPGVRPVTLESFDLLGVDKDNRLYWDGKPVEVRRRFDLTFWQKLGAVIIVIGALGATVGLDAGFDLSCKLRWWSCSLRAEGEVPEISPQSTPPATSPQSTPQKLLPGTKFQQQ